MLRLLDERISPNFPGTEFGYLLAAGVGVCAGIISLTWVFGALSVGPDMYLLVLGYLD